jgi:hypothetical protein
MPFAEDHPIALTDDQIVQLRAVHGREAALDVELSLPGRGRWRRRGSDRCGRKVQLP